jgi:hypothetical protein
MDTPSNDDSGWNVETGRMPTLEDLVEICRELNSRGTNYVVVGGFAIRVAGYMRETMDMDFLVDPSLENEAKVCKALEILPDKAVLEMDPGDVGRYTVVRIGDDVTVDLMASTSGITLAEARASNDIVTHVIDGVPIPFASPRLLLRMKSISFREKDKMDCIFLRQQFPELIEPLS